MFIFTAHAWQTIFTTENQNESIFKLGAKLEEILTFTIVFSNIFSHIFSKKYNAIKAAYKSNMAVPIVRRAVYFEVNFLFSIDI